jgi:hypothetical protein
VAVALFAALAYAVTQGSRGSASMLTDEKARLVASDILQYGNGLRPIIDRMMLMGGVLDTDSPAGSGILFNVPGSGSAPLTRELFDATGGNAPYLKPPQEACLSTCTYAFSGQYTMTGLGDNAKPELVMLLVDIPQTVCKMINNVLGQGSTIPTGTALTTLAPFDGTNYGAATAITLAGGYHALCYKESTGAGRYIYVNVVRRR